MKFDSYHPIINFIYFTAAILCAVCFQHPVYLLISYGSAFAYSVKLNGKKGLILNVCLIPFIGVYAAIYSYYNHFGITNLRSNFIGNQITLESVVYGLVTGVTAATVLMIFSCVFAIVSSDKIVYLFGRLSPRLSLFFSVILRCVPRIKERGKRIELSRKGIGKGCFQGNLWKRLLHSISFVSILITWTLEDFVESAASMKSRGYSLKGRTAFSIYRFDNRDRVFVVSWFFCLMLTVVAACLNQTDIYYNPQIVMNRITGISCVFYLAYGALLLLPVVLQIIGEWRFKRK